MYAQLDESNDYAIDALPVAFEPVETDVIVFQDLEESGSLEDIGFVIEQAFSDLSMLIRQQTLIAEAIDQNDVIQQSTTLNNTVALRQRLEQRYKSRRTVSFATETFHCGYSVVVALEAEKEVQKGVFKTMVDAIVKAFKWLWDKMAAFFKTPVTDDETKRTKLTDKVKTAEASNIKPEPDSEANVGLAAMFPELDGVITAKHFEDQLVLAMSNAEKLVKMYDIVTLCIGIVKEIGNTINVDPTADFKETIQRNEISLNDSLKSFATITREEAKSVGLDLPETVQSEQIHGLNGFTKGGKFIIWIVETNGVKHPKSALKSMPAKEGNRTFKVGTSNELNDIAKKVSQLNDLLAKNIKRFESMTETAKIFTTNILPQYLQETSDKLEEALIAKEKKPNLNYLMKIFTFYAQDIASLIQGITQALHRCGETATTADKYIEFSSSKYGEKKKEEKA